MSILVKILTWVSYSLLITLLSVLLGIGFLFSDSGSKLLINIANKNVQGLNIEYDSGSLRDALILERLSFSSEQITVNAHKIDLDIGWSCTFSLKFCIEHLSIEKTDIVSASNEDSSEVSETQSEIIKLPFLFELGTFKLSELRYFSASTQVQNEVELSELLESGKKALVSVSDLTTSLSMYDSLTINSLNVAEIDVAKQGETEQPPVNTSANAEASLESNLKALLAKLELEYEPIEIPSVFLPIHFELNNLAVGSVCLNSGETCLNAFSVSAKHFDQIIESRITLRNFSLRDESQGDAAAIIANDLSNFDLSLRSDIAQGLNTEFQLDAESIQYTNMQVVSNFNTSSINLKARSGLNRDMFLSLDATAELNVNDLPAELNLMLKKLPYSLVPNWQPNSEISLALFGNLQQYDLQLVTQNLLINEFGLNSLSSRLRWVENKLALDSIALDAVFKQQTVSASGGFAINSKGRVETDTFTFNAPKSELRIEGQGHLFEKQAAKNRLPASLQLKTKLEDLSYYLSDYNGSITLNANIASPLLKPRLKVDFDAENLQGVGASISKIDAEGSLNLQQKWASRFSIDIVGVQYNEYSVPLIELNLKGDEVTQQLSLSLPEGDIKTKQTIEGKFVFLNNESESLLDNSPIAWEGKWLDSYFEFESLELNSDEQTPIDFNFKDASLTLPQKCWSQQYVLSTCINLFEASADTGRIDIKSDFALTNLLKSLNQVELASQVNQYIDITPSRLVLASAIEATWGGKQGLTLLHRLDASEISIVKNENTTTIETFELVNKIEDKSMFNKLSIQSTDLGSVNFEGRIFEADKQLQNKTVTRLHEGELAITGIKLNKLSAYIPQLNRLNGEINGQVTISDALRKPTLNGKVTLNNGEFLLSNMPLRLSEWQHTFEFNEKRLESRGDFRLGTYRSGGRAQVTASIDFEDAFTVDGTLQGDSLALEYEKHYLTVSPDLEFSLSADLIKVLGSIDIPTAKIVIESLPQGAKSPSTDIKIIDQEEETAEAGPSIIANLDITIDEPKDKTVRLEAFDLKTALHGDLNLRMIDSDLNLVGKVNLLDGEYRAYGQALSIQQGEISFTGQADIPILDIRAIRNPLYTSDNVIAGISVTGTSIEPSVSLFSDPGMDQVKQLSYLLTGRDLDKENESQSSNAQLINTLVNFGIGRSESGVGRIGRKLGVDNLNLQAAGDGDRTQVQLSGQLSDRLRVSYGLGVFDSISELKLRYDLFPDIYLEAVSGAENALDLFYEIERQ